MLDLTSRETVFILVQRDALVFKGEQCGKRNKIDNTTDW